jgi:hypothetical protein
MESHQETEMFADEMPAYQEARRHWTRSKEEKAETFAMHLSKISKFNLREIILEEENKLLSDIIITAILDTPTKFFTIKEVRNKKSKSKEGTELRSHNQSSSFNYVKQSLDTASFDPNER